MQQPRRWAIIRRALLGMTNLERRWLAAWAARYIKPESGELTVIRGRWDEDDGGADIGAISLPTAAASRNGRAR